VLFSFTPTQAAEVGVSLALPPVGAAIAGYRLGQAVAPRLQQAASEARDSVTTWYDAALSAGSSWMHARRQEVEHAYQSASQVAAKVSYQWDHTRIDIVNPFRVSST